MAYWKDDSSLKMEWRYPGMAFFDELLVHFDKDGNIRIRRWVNMNSQATELPEIEMQKICCQAKDSENI